MHFYKNSSFYNKQFGTDPKILFSENSSEAKTSNFCPKLLSALSIPETAYRQDLSFRMLCSACMGLKVEQFELKMLIVYLLVKLYRQIKSTA